MKTILTSLYAMWLGFSLAVCGISVTTIEYWFIVVPTVLLVGLSQIVLNRENHEH